MPYNPLETLATVYDLHELPNSERQFMVRPLNFIANAYEAPGFGHVGSMDATGLFGRIRMETLILNPFFVDAPLLSIDRMHVFGRELLVVEMYDSLVGYVFPTNELQEVAALCPNKPKEDEHWYDHLIVKPNLNLAGKRKDAASFDTATEAFLLAYLESAMKAPVCNPDEKRLKAQAYSEGLLENGGPATDPVKKAMGDEWTARLFRQVLFGTHSLE